MAFNDGFYWYKNVLKKQLKLVLRIYLSIAIFLSPIYLINLANASAAEKWTIQEISYDNVAKNIKIQAEKNYGPSANDNKYKVKVPVTASAAGSTALSMFRMGVAGAALYGLVEGVGWIIDNGVVKKLEEQNSDDNNAFEYLWVVINVNESSPDPKCRSAGRYSTTTKAISHITSCNLLRQIQNTSCSMTSINSIDCVGKYPEGFTSSAGQVLREKNNNYDPSIQPPYVPVSPSEMGNKIIESPAAPQILPDIYNPNNPVSRPSPAPNLADIALENAPPIPKQNPNGDTNPKPNEDTDGDGELDAFNPEKPSVGTEFTLPEFCSWAVTVCEWYVSYKQDSRKTDNHREKELTFWEKVEDWFDWTKDDSDLPENEEPTDIQDLNIDASEVNLSASSTCPQDSVSFSVMGKSVTLDMPYQPVCDALNFFKPAVLLVGAVASVYIVAGVRTKEEDEV